MQRAGTTWLYKNFQENEKLRGFPFKEIHYFDNNISSSPNYKKSFFQRIIHRKSILRMIKGIRFFVNSKKCDFNWLTNLIFSDYDDKFYKKLFDVNIPIKGDLTPSYSMLNISEIKRMYNLAPDAKIIYIIRNPIDRAWSALIKNKKNISNYNEKELIKFLSSSSSFKRSDAISTINKYLMVYPKKQFKVFFFDDLENNPKKMLGDIYEFLGININCEKVLTKKINNYNKPEIPKNVLIFLKKKYRNIMHELSVKYGGYCKEWYKKYYFFEEYP